MMMTMTAIGGMKLRRAKSESHEHGYHLCSRVVLGYAAQCAPVWFVTVTGSCLLRRFGSSNV